MFNFIAALMLGGLLALALAVWVYQIYFDAHE
jgi:hypothetical protein